MLLSNILFFSVVKLLYFSDINFFNTWLMRALRRRQYFQKSTFISYSKLLPQIFQTNIRRWGYRCDDVNQDNGLYWDTLGCNWAVLDCTGLYLTVMDFTVLYWTLLGRNGL